MEMDAEPITIMVDPEAARVFRDSSRETQEELAKLFAHRLRVSSAGPRQSLDQIMDEIGNQAQARGMTPEILRSILEDEN
jgi:hypothetical protein